jgi:hypothetical protein
VQKSKLTSIRKAGLKSNQIPLNRNARMNGTSQATKSCITPVGLKFQQSNGRSSSHVIMASHMTGSTSRNALVILSIPYMRVTNQALRPTDCVSDELISILKPLKLSGKIYRGPKTMQVETSGVKNLTYVRFKFTFCL